MSKPLRTGPHWYDRIQYILESIEKIQNLTANMTYEQFNENLTVRDSIAYKMQIIGDSGKHIPKRTVGEQATDKLKILQRQRNILAHGYYAIDYQDLWDNATETIQLLKPELQKIADEHQRNHATDLQLNTIARTISETEKNRPLTTQHPLLPISPTPTESQNAPSKLILRGRAEEFNFLARRLRTTPSPIATITAPPTLGTTTLLHSVHTYACRIGHIVVHLEPEDLPSCIKIAEKCRAATLAQCNESDHNLSPSNANLPVFLTNRAHELFNELGTEIDNAKQNIDTSCTHEAIDLLHHLSAICHYQARPHQVLITCDNIHQLTKHNRPQRIATRNNLNTLNRSINHPNIQIPVRTILAGHSLDPYFLQNIISLEPHEKPHVLQLTTIPPEYGHQILLDYLHDPEYPPQLATFYDSENIDLWGNECQGYPALATQLGEMLQNFASQRIGKGQLQATIRNHDSINIQFQQMQKDTCAQLFPPKTTPEGKRVHLFTHHLVAACSPEHACHQPNVNAPPQPLTQPFVYALARNMLQLESPHEKDWQHHQHQRNLIQELQQRNIIHTMVANSEFPLLDMQSNPADRVIFPIPHMISYINRQSEQLDPKTRERIASVVEHTQTEIGPKITQANTRWHWHNTSKRGPILLVPDIAHQPSVRYENAPEPQAPRQENVHGAIDPSDNPREALATINRPNRNIAE